MAVQTLVPSGTVADGQPVTPSQRYDGTGGIWTLAPSNKETGAAAEGTYVTAVSPTPGTGIIGHAAPTTFDETKPYLYVFNPSSSSRVLYPQYLRLHDTVVSVGGARVQFTVTKDTGNLYSSGGTAAAIAATNSKSPVATGGLVIFQGAVVASAATSARTLHGNYCQRGTIDVVEDNYRLIWASPDSMVAGSRAATVMDFGEALPPMAINPGECLKVHQWAASQSTGPTFEMVFGFILR